MIKSTVISWCPYGIGIRDDDDMLFEPLQIPEDHQLPALPNQLNTVQAIYLPMEHLLVRHFTFPLQHPKFLDKNILLEELADTADINPDEWWLTWKAKAVEGGIAGMVFGLRKTLKDELSNTSPWQTAPFVLVDGWQRLNHWLNASTTDTAVIDVDAEGVFFGVYKSGTWFGMRRLNADMHDANVRSSVAQETLWSLQAMGFDSEVMGIKGRITTEFSSHLPQDESAEVASEESKLPQRHMLNLTLNTPETNDKTTLNIRHGSWATRSTPAALRIWYRPALLAAGIAFLWLFLTVADNYQLEAQLENMQNDITAAFHRGLPDQPVMIDALAQLKQAAGDGGSINRSEQVSTQLQIISQVFQDTPWQMQELNIIKGSKTLAGKVNSLDTLNTIKDKLSAQSQSKVQIADTDLNGDEVSFRIRW